MCRHAHAREAGLRTRSYGWVERWDLQALPWTEVDLERRRIVVSHWLSRDQPYYCDESEARIAPISDELLRILVDSKDRDGLVLKPTCRDRGGRPDLGFYPTYIQPRTLHKYLKLALAACGLPNITWDQATRFTFRAQSRLRKQPELPGRLQPAPILDSLADLWK